jgi:hypothetical protein
MNIAAVALALLAVSEVAPAAARQPWHCCRCYRDVPKSQFIVVCHEGHGEKGACPLPVLPANVPVHVKCGGRVREGVSADCPVCREDRLWAKRRPAIEKELPGHSSVRKASASLSEGPRKVEVHVLLHPQGARCAECPGGIRPLLGITYVENSDLKEEVKVLRSESQLSAFLRSCKLSGKDEAGRKELAIRAAVLVQELWPPVHSGDTVIVPGEGKVGPLDSLRLKETDSGWTATFELKKGHRFFVLVVTFDRDGTFVDLRTSDTGRSCH